MYDKHLGKNLVCPMCAHNPAVHVVYKLFGRL